MSPTTSPLHGPSGRDRLAPGPLVIAIGLLGFAIALVVLSGPEWQAGFALCVFAAMMIAWTVLELPQTPVALAGALALIVTGVGEDEDLFEALGSEIVWLMLAAFILASVLARTGIAERLALAVLSRIGRVSTLFWATTGVIVLSAFFIPSTSARAAVLLPVFLALAAAVNCSSVTRALGLLFPSVILLSAAASLTGAGAHLVAVDFIDRTADTEIGFLSWAILAMPFAAATSALACCLILFLFLGPEDRAVVIAPRNRITPPLSARDWRVIAIAGAVVVFWMLEGLHGLDLATVAIAGALVASMAPVSGVSFRDALKGVEWDLLIFLSAALFIGETLLDAGAADHLVRLVVEGAGDALRAGPWVPVALAAGLSALAHLLVISRTARATVLIPALAVPLSGFGVDVTLLILTVTVGSGFCQTFMVSAKPVALFGAGESPPFSQTDLMRLALFLLPPFVLLLVLTALLYWPLLLVSD